MEESRVYEVAEGVDYIAGDSPSYDMTSFITRPQVTPVPVPGYDVANYPSPKPKVFNSGCNPCYDMGGTAAPVTAPSANLKAKKPPYDCPCSWVCIGLVLVCAVACVSMAVSVWSIAMVYDISSRCEAQKNSEVM